MSDNKSLNLFNEFLNKYKFKNNLNLKYKNNKFYRKNNLGWYLDNTPPKIVKNIYPYKIAAQHFDVNVPYTNYYIINIEDETIYSGYSSYSYLVNNLKELIEDLNKVIEGTFNQSKFNINNNFDPLDF